MHVDSISLHESKELLSHMTANQFLSRKAWQKLIQNTGHFANFLTLLTKCTSPCPECHQERTFGSSNQYEFFKEVVYSNLHCY